MLDAMRLALRLSTQDDTDPLKAPYTRVNAIYAAANLHDLDPGELAAYIGGKYEAEYVEHVERIATV